MRVLAFAFAVLLAGVNALPSLQVEKAIGQGRLITDSIEDAIEDAIEGISQAIVDAGLDPLIIEHEAIDYALPVPSIFNVHAHLTDLLFKGASNIVIKRRKLNLITLKLTLDIELPEILLSVGDSELDATILGKNLNGHFSGSLAIKSTELHATIQVSIGIISGVSVKDVAITFDLGSVDSQFKLLVQQVDLSSQLNNFLGGTIPATLKENEKDINKLLTILGKTAIESIL